MFLPTSFLFFFFFNDTATTEIYTLSLHDALPISIEDVDPEGAFFSKIVDDKVLEAVDALPTEFREVLVLSEDRKSTRLNSSHLVISYAVFCLKKKKKTKKV